MRLLLHPIVGFERDPEGRIVRVTDARESGGREWTMRVELERPLTPDEGQALVATVHDALADLQLAVGDFAPMQAVVERMAAAVHDAAAVRDAEEVEETAAFLDWLRDGHFILLGAREYEITEGAEGPSVQVKLGSGLGILRDNGTSRFALPSSLRKLPEFLRAAPHGERRSARDRQDQPHLARAPARAHGRRLGAGAAAGRNARRPASRDRAVHALVYLEQASRTPLLRRKLQAILEAEGLIEGSHDYKATVAAFESFPRDELFQAPVEALRAEIVAAARAEEAQRVTLTERRDAASRNITVMVAMPGDRMSTELRIRLQNLLAARYGAQSVEYHLALVEGAAAQLFFLLHIPEEGAPEVDLDELEKEVARLARTWDDRLIDELVARHGDAEGRRLAAIYCPRLPDYYKTATSPELALVDIELLERVAAGEVAVLLTHSGRTRAVRSPARRRPSASSRVGRATSSSIRRSSQVRARRATSFSSSSRSTSGAPSSGMCSRKKSCAAGRPPRREVILDHDWAPSAGGEQVLQADAQLGAGECGRPGVARPSRVMLRLAASRRLVSVTRCASSARGAAATISARSASTGACEQLRQPGERLEGRDRRLVVGATPR